MNISPCPSTLARTTAALQPGLNLSSGLLPVAIVAQSRGLGLSGSSGIKLLRSCSECNMQSRQITEEQRANARIHGPPEHQYLIWMNNQVKIRRRWKRANADDTGGPKNLTPERLLPYQLHDPKEGFKKLNVVWYAFEMYRELLFPFYREICRHNRGR